MARSAAAWLGVALVMLYGVCGLGGCGEDYLEDPPEDENTATDGDQEAAAEPAMIAVSGVAYAFNLPGTPYGVIADATLSILEMPGIETTSDAEGEFAFEALPAGEQATFVLTAEGFPEAQTKTFTLPEEDLDWVTFQVPDNDLFALIAASLGVNPSAEFCQMVTTVTVVGKMIADEGSHGEEGATVSSDPEIEAASGPIYFNEDVLPDPERTESSDDGGILFTNVPPGVYTLSAHKDGVDFESVTMTCRPGVFVNASPPYGLQALE